MAKEASFCQSRFDDYCVQCAISDFFERERPCLFKRLQRQSKSPDLKELLLNIEIQPAYLRQFTKLSNDPNAIEKRRKILADPHALKSVGSLPLSKMLTLQANCIRMLANEQKRDKHLQARKILNQIYVEWEKQTAHSSSGSDFFKWPSAEAAHGDGSLRADGWPEKGMLISLGYTVNREEAKLARMRRIILDEVFAGSLPPIESPEYVREWGGPKTPRRLKKMADAIATFTRNAKQRSDSKFAYAIVHWQNDLDYLYQKYYVGHFHFCWPTDRD